MGLGGGEQAIETHGLRRVFKTRKQVVEAVAGVDLTVKSGEIFGFLGPNGAGKTTTLRMLATLLPPTGGTARVAGCDLAREPDKVRKLIGYVSQAGGSDYEVVGRFELVFQGRLYGLSLAAANKRAAELIEMLELEICADRPVKHIRVDRSAASTSGSGWFTTQSCFSLTNRRLGSTRSR